jgi:hypothetical protein
VFTGLGIVGPISKRKSPFGLLECRFLFFDAFLISFGVSAQICQDLTKRLMVYKLKLTNAELQFIANILTKAIKSNAIPQLGCIGLCPESNKQESVICFNYGMDP